MLTTTVNDRLAAIEDARSLWQDEIDRPYMCLSVPDYRWLVAAVRELNVALDIAVDHAARYEIALKESGLIFPDATPEEQADVARVLTALAGTFTPIYSETERSLGCGN